MKYLIDTDIISYYLRGKYNLLTVFERKGFSNLKLSIITVAELEVLAHKSPHSKISFSTINTFAQEVGVLNVNQDTWKLYSKTKAEAMKKGNTVGDLDFLQASLAKQHNLIVVTNNIKHYTGIVEIENWSKNQQN